MKLPEAGGPARDLNEFRRKNVILVFFQNTCSHCEGQLRDLVAQARKSLGPDHEIVAVSSLEVDDPSWALKELGVSPTDRFHLLVNESHRAFRDFGCYASGPKHGLFLIDRNGFVRARYVGDSPFRDTPEVIRRVRALATETDSASR